MLSIRTETWNGHEIRFVEKEPGEWWAVAKDVAQALGYQPTTNMTRLIEPLDKGIRKVNTPGGAQDLLTISEFGIYDAVFNSRKKEAKEFKRWVFDMLKELRRSTGLEGFQVFRMLDKEHQKAAMAKLNAGLEKPVRVDFIKANTITNKAVSTKHGYPKMLKKREMGPKMLVDRQAILEDTVELMGVVSRFGLRVPVAETIYSKHSARHQRSDKQWQSV